MQVVVCNCEAGVCSCDRSCSFAWPKITIVLAVAVVDDKCAAIAIVLAVMPSYNPSIAVALAIVGVMWDAVVLVVAVVR